MKHKKKIVISVIAVGIGFVLIGGMLNGTEKQETVLGGDPKGKFVNVGETKVQDIQTKISSTGILQAKATEKIYSEVNTQVKEVNVEIGDVVKKGDVLIVFDNETKENIERDLKQLDLQLESARITLNQLQTATNQNIMNAELSVTSKKNAIVEAEDAIRQTEASLEVAKEDLKKVQNQYDVTKALYDQGLESKIKLDEKEKELKMSSDQVTTLESKITSLKNNLEIATKQLETATYDLDVLLNNVEDKTKAENIQMKKNEIASLQLKRESLVDQMDKSVLNVVSPVDGVISQLNIQEGQFVTPGAEMLRIINPDQLIVKAEISPYYAAQLVEGLKVNVKYNGSTSVETTGVVSMVSPVAIQKQAANNGASTTAIPVEITLDEAKGLKEGLLVDLKIITADVADVISVPLLATLEDKEDQAYVFVVGENGILEKRYVKEGAADNHYVQVSDLKEGELVVTNPTEALTDGMTVSYKPLKEKTGDTK